ncbi:HSP20-like chaperone [Hypoxylon sp. FL1284]|nr:HSP20-like chaperone [Hypoxylon sp. FL1284]
MANNNNNTNQPMNFADFIQAFSPSARTGEGVDHANAGPPHPPHGFPFDASQFNNPFFGHGWGAHWGAGPWGPGHRGGGRHGRRDYREVPDSDREDDQDEEMGGSPETETMRPTPNSSAAGDAPPPPPAGAPHQPPQQPFQHGHGPSFGPQYGRGGWGGWGERRGRCGRGPRRGPPPPPNYAGAWDFRPLIHAFASHPLAQTFRDYMEPVHGDARGESNEQHDDAFTPPVDIFNTENAYVLHVSLPGAVKEDIGVNWDGEKVNIAGVVYRPGSEEFLQSMTSSERKVGMFERSIKLPPPGSAEKEEVDGFSITAKMENGILIVAVPKIEKEWTEIHKVDIE